MKGSMKLFAAISLAPLVLTACESPVTPKQSLHAGFGDAVRHNMAVQIVNPDGHPDLSPSALDGARAEDAVRRYRAGKTKEVVRVKTSDVGGEAK